jgi:glutathione S-transferase
MQLFHSAGSPYARIARMAVLELGLEGRIAFTETTLRDPASTLLPHNPVGRVPSLVLADGTTVTETTPILMVLDSLVASDRRLLSDGADGWKRLAAYGRVLGMLDGIAVWNRELRRPVHERSPGVIALEETRAARIAAALQDDVARGVYVVPDAGFLALLAVLGYCERRHRVWPWRDGLPGLAAWFDRASVRPSFAATMPPVSGI